MTHISEEDYAEYIALKRTKAILERNGFSEDSCDEHFPGAPEEHIPRGPRKPWEGVDLHVPVRSTHHHANLGELNYYSDLSLQSTHYTNKHHEVSTLPCSTHHTNNAHKINTCVSGGQYLDQAREVAKKALRRKY